MRLHDRYFLRELIAPLFFLLGAFVILGVSFFFTKELETIQERKLDLMEVAAYCASSLLEFFVLILPILLLLALLYALAQHARHNEITALRATGVSLWRACAPYFAVGLAATGIYFVMNEFAVPAGDRWAEQILDRHVLKDDAQTKRPESRNVFNAPKRRHWQFSQFNEQTGEMLNPTVSWTLPDGSWRLVRSERAVRTNGVWTFYQVQAYSQSGSHGETQTTGSNYVLRLPELDETPERIQRLVKYADSNTLHGSGYADIPLAELWELLQNKPDLSREDANAVETKFYGRLAMPWTCLVVVLMAIPFGAAAGRRNLFYGVAGSIFIGFAYIILQRVSLAFGMNGQLPGWLAAWLPNMLFAAAGIVLILRVR